MFHVENNLFFGRLDNGDVRVVMFKSTPSEWPVVTRQYPRIFTEFDFTLSASVWPSIVASVSKKGEGDGRFYKAQAFHMNTGESK